MKPKLFLIDPAGGEVLPLKQVERVYVEYAIEQLNGNISELADKLGVSRATVYRKLQEHDLTSKLLQFRGRKK